MYVSALSQGISPLKWMIYRQIVAGRDAVSPSCCFVSRSAEHGDFLPRLTPSLPPVSSTATHTNKNMLFTVLQKTKHAEIVRADKAVSFNGPLRGHAEKRRTGRTPTSLISIVLSCRPSLLTGTGHVWYKRQPERCTDGNRWSVYQVWLYTWWNCFSSVSHDFLPPPRRFRCLC